MFRDNSVDSTKINSGSDIKAALNTHKKVVGIPVPTELKRKTTSRLTRSQSHPNPTNVLTSLPLSQVTILQDLTHAKSRSYFNSSNIAELKTPINSSDNSELEMFSSVNLSHSSQALFTESDALQIATDKQKNETSSPSSAQLLASNESSLIAPALSSVMISNSIAAVPAIKSMPLPLTSSMLVESQAAVQQNKHDLDIIIDKIAEKLKERITQDLREEGQASGHLESKVGDDNGAIIKRAVRHIVYETMEVVGWTPKKLKQASLDQNFDDGKVFGPNVFIHYLHPLYDAMMRAFQLSGEYDYDPKHFFHKHHPKLPTGKKATLPKSVVGSKPPRDKVKNLQQLLDGARVIVPICIGFDGALTEEELEKVLMFYVDHKVAEITVYIGEYNRLEDPENRLEEIGKLKREAWQENNKSYLDKCNGCDVHLMPSLPVDLPQYRSSYILVNTSKLYYIKPNAKIEEVIVIDFQKFLTDLQVLNTNNENKIHLSMQQNIDLITSKNAETRGHTRSCIKILLREELIQTTEYKNAENFVLKKLSNQELSFKSVSQDAYGYMTGKQKPSTPQLSSMRTDTVGGITKLELGSSSNETDDQVFSAKDDAEIISELMLCNDEEDAQKSSEFYDVAKAVVHEAIKDSKNKVDDAVEFLLKFRKAIGGDSIYKKNTMFSSSASSAKQKKMQIVHPAQTNNGPRKV